MSDKFRITIASLPDRERPVAEILYEGFQWAEISEEIDDKRLTNEESLKIKLPSQSTSELVYLKI